MKYIIIKICVFILNVIYSILKLFKTENKITMISRQSNSISIDFSLLKDEIDKHGKYKVVILCKKLNGKENASVLELIKYGLHMFKQMYHIATSKVVILDSYCIVISILKHKKSLKVIQMWHSIGTMKKFGYDILDKEEGNSSLMAKTINMHKGYDVILCAGRGYVHDLARQFNYDKKYIKIIPLPRLDLITNKKYQKDIKEKIYKDYSSLNKKKNILYVPTFRNDDELLKKNIDILSSNIDYDKYNFIIKLHPLSNIKLNNKNVIFDKKYSSMDMIVVSDYVITDYSCILYEAGVLNKKLFFYPFDYDEYLNNRDLNIDYFNDLPGYISKDGKELISFIEKDNYDMVYLKKFIDKYVEYDGNSCKKIYDLIEKIV